MARTIHTREERSEQFITAGLKVAKKVGIAKTSVAKVAIDCDVTAPLIFHNFGSREKFQAALAKAAKKQGITLPADAPKAPARKRATGEPRKRSAAEVKAIKKAAAPKPKVTKKAAAPKPKAPKAVKRATAPKAVVAPKVPKVVTAAKRPKAVVAAEQPSVSGKFVAMPTPASADSKP